MKRHVTCNHGFNHQIIECGIIECAEKTTDTSNIGFYEMKPPLGSLSAADPAWICETHLNIINAMFGIPAIQRP